MMELPEQISAILRGAPDCDTALAKSLNLVLAHYKSETGTIHLLDQRNPVLHLAAQTGLPPSLLDTVRNIPVGKGIAGQTVARGEPVRICNLQTDTSGVARAGARATGVGGALCVPLRKGPQIVGTIGIGTIRQYEYSPEETRQLEEIGRRIGEYVARA